MLTACSPLGGLPTQSAPSCSWDSNPPANAETECQIVYATLNGIARAEASGDNRAVRQSVPDKQAAARIVAFGRTLRRQAPVSLHVVPSITLRSAGQEIVGAGFYLVGSTRHGHIARPQTVFVKLQGDRAYLVQDQPGQEW